MSDQHVITDYRAYFASLGPGAPFTAEQLEAMRDKAPSMILILDAAPGHLMTRLLLQEATCFSEALALWEAAGKPRAWLQLGNSSAPWFCDAASLPSRGKVRSK